MEKILITNAAIWLLVILATFFSSTAFLANVSYYEILLVIAAIASLLLSWFILQRNQASSRLTSILNQIEQINAEQAFHKRIDTQNTEELKKLAAAINNTFNYANLLQEQLGSRLILNTEHLENLAKFNQNLASTIKNNLTAKFHLTEAEKNLIAQACYDQLTELPNSFYFHELVNRIIIKANRNKTLAGIFLLDIDNFSDIAREYNPDVSDLYIQHIANQLTLALRKTDLLARIGEDKFIIAAEDLNEKETIKIILDRIFIFLKQPLKVADQKIIKTVSIGVSTFPDDSRSLEKLEAYADFALYFAKKQGGNIYCYYDDIKNIVSVIRT